MDPFNTLYDSTEPLVDQLQVTSPQSLEFHTLQDDILSCIHDLEESIKIVESSGNFQISDIELTSRKDRVKNLRNKVSSILKDKKIDNLQGSYSDNPFADDVNNNFDDGNDDDSNRATKEYHQQLLQQQDDLISNELTQSINNLHQQALTINEELDNQDTLLNNVEDKMDILNSKILGSGMKRIQHLLDDNEMAGNCCIGLLIIVLILILVLLIIV